MPGIVLTERSDKSVQHPHSQNEKPDIELAYMSWEDLIYLTDLFLAGGERSITLMGSDPLDHPHFMDITAYLLERGCHVSVQTSGMASDQMIEDAVQMNSFLHKDRVDFLCDLTDLAHDKIQELQPADITQFLKTLNNRVTPWISLEDLSFSLEQIVSLINTHNLRRVIRISLRQPGESEGRMYFEPEQIVEAVNRLFSQKELLSGLMPGFC